MGLQYADLVADVLGEGEYVVALSEVGSDAEVGLLGLLNGAQMGEGGVHERMVSDTFDIGQSLA